MPELPEVETVRIALARELQGRRIVKTRVHDSRLRFGVDVPRIETLLNDREVVQVRRRAKYLLVNLAGDDVVLLHLGMSGRLLFREPQVAREIHDHVVFTLDDLRELRFNDPRRFGMLDMFPRSEESHHPRLVHLGVEPLTSGFTAESMRRLARRSRRPIKNFLMDASKVVGIGNIYASEALFMAGVHPMRAAGRIGLERWVRLVSSVKTVLGDAITRGGTTLRDFVDTGGERGVYGERLQVYGNAGLSCPRDDGGTIRRVVMLGRSTYYCPRCQR